MHSRAERRDGGTAGRRGAAATGLILLLVLIGLALWPPRSARVIHREFTHAPSPVERDSLAALAASGTTVTWSGAIQPLAMELDADPRAGAVRVAVAAPPGSRVVAGDAMGVLDSVTVDAGAPGATLRLNGVTGTLTVRSQGENLRAALQHQSARAVAVFGPAGWESRFLLEALDAFLTPCSPPPCGLTPCPTPPCGRTPCPPLPYGRGGTRGQDCVRRVMARIRVGPQTYVTQGRPLPLNTATHAVAVVLGAMDGPTANEIRRFVRAGGGLVLASGATGFDDIAPGRFGTAQRPPASLSLPSGREQLVFRPIRRLEAGATALDAPDAVIRTAVRRVGAGRVVQLADEDTWRLALASDAGRAAHARLWLAAIATASPRDVARPAPDDDMAPRAALVAALGPVSEDTGTHLPQVDWTSVVALLLFGMLVGEWAVRRIGGRA